MTNLKIEVGKKYKTRDGYTIEITHNDNHEIYPFDFVSADEDGEYFSGSLTAEGKYFGDGDSSGYDVVSEVTSPEKETQETNLREETRAISTLLYHYLSVVEYVYAIDPSDENKTSLELAQQAIEEYLWLVTKDT